MDAEWEGKRNTKCLVELQPINCEKYKHRSSQSLHFKPLFSAHFFLPFRFLPGENMVPKQTVKVQEDHEERSLWSRGRSPRPAATSLLLSMLSVGHQYGCQGPACPLWRIHEQFWTLVLWTSAGHHAKDSDDVTDGTDARPLGSVVDIIPACWTGKYMATCALHCLQFEPLWR